VLIHQQLIRAFLKCSNLDATEFFNNSSTMHLAADLEFIVPCSNFALKTVANLPSVSVLGTVKSSSLVMCLCPSDPTKGIDEGVRADECAEFDVDDREGGRRAGLHGECELVDVLVEAANGTPADDGYKS
jgi:hypothetical protein